MREIQAGRDCNLKGGEGHEDRPIVNLKIRSKDGRLARREKIDCDRAGLRTAPLHIHPFSLGVSFAYDQRAYAERDLRRLIIKAYDLGRQAQACADRDEFITRSLRIIETPKLESGRGS